jgi:hypothetical protein
MPNSAIHAPASAISPFVTSGVEATSAGLISF